jgi:hypothetical protein
MRSRYAYLSLILIAALAGTVGGYYILPSLTPPHTTAPVKPTSTIHIPERSHYAPSDWNYTLGLLSPNFHYPWNFTVIIGLNNTIEWINDDTWAHTVTALKVPQGAAFFDSGLIDYGKSFVVTLTVPGVYTYDCAWHPWLAGIITVKTS